MPHKGESAAFFSHHSIAIFWQVSPFLPLPSSPLAGPLPHCYAGRVGPEKFPRRSPNFVLPAKARVGGRRPTSGSGAGFGAGGRLTPSAGLARWNNRGSGRRSSRGSRPQRRQMLPAGGRGRRGSAVSQTRERLQEPAAAGCFVQPRAQRTRRDPACRGSGEGAGLPRCCPLARPPALCCTRSGYRSPLAVEHRGAPRPPPAGAESTRKAIARWRQRERASEREPGRKPPGQSGRTRARRELRGKRKDCQLPSSPQALAPNLSAELGT